MSFDLKVRSPCGEVENYFTSSPIDDMPLQKKLRIELLNNVPSVSWWIISYITLFDKYNVINR
jgi:hypothetical protein